METAALQHLTYVDDRVPGIRRIRRGRGFIYLGPTGERIRDERTLERIRLLVIPPAWEQVWIAPRPDAHIQATGRDNRSRKQYAYHPKWQEARSRTKFDRLLRFGRRLPVIRERVDRDLAEPAMSRRRAAAFVVRLLEVTNMRIGNSEYARLNHSYGLTTLENDHVAVHGSHLHLNFPGKRQKRQIVDIHDRRLAHLARKYQELPGQELVQYVDGSGESVTVDSGDVNAYIEEVAGEEFTAKDFRTWGGTVLAAEELHRMGAAETKEQIRKNVTRAIRSTAARLGNTPAVCRKYYTHPAVLESYENGDLFAAWKRAAQAAGRVKDRRPYGWSLPERVALDLLRRLERRS